MDTSDFSELLSVVEFSEFVELFLLSVVEEFWEFSALFCISELPLELFSSAQAVKQKIITTEKIIIKIFFIQTSILLIVIPRSPLFACRSAP